MSATATLAPVPPRPSPPNLPNLFNGEILLTELDFVRLSKLQSPELADRLDVADLVASPAVPPDVVTMYSQIETLDTGFGQTQKLTLCYPQDAEPGTGFISVCSPLGASLLGRRVGDSVRWQTPLGLERSVSIQAVLFQPEASGDFTT